MNGKQHIDIMTQFIKEYGEKFIKDMQDYIDGTSDVLTRWHRNDGTHDPVFQIFKYFKENPDEWYKNIFKVWKIINVTQYHQIQDAAVAKVGDKINGHIITQEMITAAKKAVECMKEGKVPDLKKFLWTLKKGKWILTKAERANHIKECKSIPFSKIGTAAKKGGIWGAAISATISVGKNGWGVIKKKKTLKQASVNIVKDTSRGAIGGAVASFTGSLTSIGATAGLVLIGISPVGLPVMITIGVTSFVAAGTAAHYTDKLVQKGWGYIPIES